MTDDQSPKLTPVVATWGCEHLTVSAVGVIESLNFGCGCEAERIVGNITTGQHS